MNGFQSTFFLLTIKYVGFVYSIANNKNNFDFYFSNDLKFMSNLISLEKNGIDISDSPNTQTKLGVVIIARNEEEVIENTIKSLISQKLKPSKIIVVDDGSKDKTYEIAQSFDEVQVVKFQRIHENWVDKPELALVINTGLNELKELNLTYVMISGADIVYPEEYSYEIYNYMEKHPEVAISGGMVNGEYSFRPRGVGRIIRTDFFKSIDFVYPVQHGFEGYLLYKAESLGFKVHALKINMKTQRKSGSRYTKYHYLEEGKACKSMGYSPLYVFGKACILARSEPANALRLLKGYTSSVKLYEKEVRNFIRKKQHSMIFHNKKEILKIVLRK